MACNRIDNCPTLAALKSYERLAKIPCNREHLLQDKTCIDFVAYILDDQDKEIVLTALEILRLLADTSANRFALRQHHHVFLALDCLLKTNDDKRIQTLINEIINIWQYSTKSTYVCNLEMKKQKSVTQELNQDDEDRCHSIFKPGLGPTKMMKLKIIGLVTKMDRKLCEDILVNVSGIISITFNMAKHQCILKTKVDVSPAIVIQAIAQTETMTAHLVNEEMKTTVSSTCNIYPDDESIQDLPRYLSEDDSFVKTDGAVSSFARVKDATYCWLNMATDFLNKSFYW